MEFFRTTLSVDHADGAATGSSLTCARAALLCSSFAGRVGESSASAMKKILAIRIVRLPSHIPMFYVKGAVRLSAHDACSAGRILARM